jgi:TPR repeat protein
MEQSSVELHLELLADPVFAAAQSKPSLVLFLKDSPPSAEQLVRSHAILAQFPEDPLSLFALGTLHLEGVGCVINLARAVELFRLSSTLGCAKAQNSMGGLHHTGSADISMQRFT